MLNSVNEKFNSKLLEVWPSKTKEAHTGTVSPYSPTRY